MSDAITAFWSLPLSELFERLQTTGHGLTSEEAQARLQRFGPNLLRLREKATPLNVFLDQLKSPIIHILLFASGVSAITHDWMDALIILAIVFGSALLSFVLEYRANAATEKLRVHLTTKVTVLLVEVLAVHIEKKRNDSREISMRDMDTHPLSVRMRDAVAWLFSPYL